MGVHPPENKKTADIPVVQVDIPKRVSVIMSQHLGVPAVPKVEKGDKVKVGTLLGEAKGLVNFLKTFVRLGEVPFISGERKAARWFHIVHARIDLKKVVFLKSAVVEKIKEVIAIVLSKLLNRNWFDVMIELPLS